MSESVDRSFADDFKRTVAPLAVLRLLRDQSMYGYEIGQRLKEVGEGKLAGVTLYPLLYKLERQGYVEVVNTVVVEGHARSYYALTRKGEAYLARATAEYLDLSRIFRETLEDENGSSGPIA